MKEDAKAQNAIQLADARASSIAARKAKALEKAQDKTDRRIDADDDFSVFLVQAAKRLREFAENGFKLQCARCQKEFGGGDTIKDLYAAINVIYDKLYKQEPVTLKQEWNYNMKVMNRDTGEVHVPFKERIIDAEVVKDESSVDKP